MQNSSSSALAGQQQQLRRRRAPSVVLKLWMVLCMVLLNAVQHPRAVLATDDVANVSPCELESIINQLVNPSPEYQLHASALRNQLKNILRDRQLAVGEEQTLGDYDYPEEDKRSVAALAAQGLLHANKRSLATLAKNGQLPTAEPEEILDEETQSSGRNGEKRYVGALARSGGFMGYGKRNIGTLARDFQLPSGKRNLATLARLGLLSPKRNVAAVARYNSNRMGAAAAAEKRNLGALRGSPVHGLQQKREYEELQLPASANSGDMDYMDMVSGNYWPYASYADMDWGDFGRAQKRYLDTSRDPELFGIEHATPPMQQQEQELLSTQQQQQEQDTNDISFDLAYPPQLQKRHIGAVYRSGFLPSYRALRSTTGSYGGGGSGGGRFSRSGRARQFVEYYPQRERLRQPIAAVCKRCFLPNRPVVAWGAAAGMRGGRGGGGGGGVGGLLPFDDQERQMRFQLLSNALPSSAAAWSGRRSNSWGTPPRITALHRRSFRRNDDDPFENNQF